MLRTFTHKQSQVIRRKYEAGQSGDTLARQYDCNRSTVLSAVRHAGGETNNRSEVQRITAARTLSKQVALAEKLTKRNGGKLPGPSWLTENGYGALRSATYKYPKAFSHLKQELLKVFSGLSATPEYQTVNDHYRSVFKSDHPAHRNYKGMPFFDGWNPDKGGSWAAGARWIIESLGKRPDGASLHIVKHELGFVPGNLEWATKKKQSAQQMFKIISNQENQIKQLNKQLSDCRKAA